MVFIFPMSNHQGKCNISHCVNFKSTINWSSEKGMEMVSKAWSNDAKRALTLVPTVSGKGGRLPTPTPLSFLHLNATPCSPAHPSSH